MPCRVGITTNLDARKAFWESKVYGLTNWRVLAGYRSREEAQAHETRYANRYNCQSSPGGGKARGSWYVYRFDYTRTR